MFKFLLNLRIGTKLAITSALGVLLVMAMLAMQIVSNNSVSEANRRALSEQAVAAASGETKASARGLQIGMRDLRIAHMPDEAQQAMQYIEARAKAAQSFTDTLMKLIPSASGRERVQKIKGLADQYVSVAKEIAALRNKAFEISASVDGSDVSDQFSELDYQITRITRERAAPIAAELEAQANKIVEVAKQGAAEQEAAAAQAMASAERIGIGLGIAVAVVLIGATVFSMFTIARPMRALTGGMLELADGNFDVVLPGVGRKDEIGAVAGAVETFKIKSAEKARREAEAKAELDRKALAEKSELDRMAAEQKLAADQRAAAERAAATARLMSEFDAAVGGIVKAAMQGDFSQRVPLDGKDGVIRNLAGALNTMCDNIGAVMDDMVRMMSALAEGDLTRRIQAEYQGTFATLKDSANTTAERLSQIASDIKAAATDVSNAASEISTSTTDLSQRTEEQAASLEETSASMEEIAATVKKNAENAQQANKLTSGTREVADRGGQVVANAVDAMARIEDSSQKISDIIGVIDEIARQTNLLALNAAVEAARAGEAGRGFAVVASEVRSLAQRSSQAAKDIKDLITNSNSQVKEGVDLVSKAGASLAEIVESIKNVAAIVADIANASMEQATGIEQVNKALTNMDEVTQQNSALVEENAATAKTLETQSAMMNERVSFFQLTGADRQVPRMPSSKPLARAPQAKVAPPAAKRGGMVGRMQSALATALKREPEVAEF
jgi:methyl-accepting chemotaxis protein